MSMSVAASATEPRVLGSRYDRPAANDAAAPVRAPAKTVDASGSTVAATLSAVLSHLNPGGGTEASATTAPVVETTVAVKPNLDALNRVLAHYAAQSAAADTMIGIGKP